MAGYATYSLGLTIKQPRKGTKGFFLTMENDTYKKISAHDHSGSGNGVQLTGSALAANAVGGAKFRLENNTALRARNAAGLGDVNLFLLDASDRFVIQPSNLYFTDSAFTIAANTSGGADNKVLRLTGGGAYVAGRGANLLLQGEEAGGAVSLFSENGPVNIASGGAYALILTANSNIGIQILSTGAVNVPLLSASLPVFTNGAKSLITNSIATAWAALHVGATWTDYSGSVSTSGDGTNTWVVGAIQLAKYLSIGKITFIDLEWTGTLSGTPSQAVGVSLPITAASAFGTLACSILLPGGTRPVAGAVMFSSTTVAAISKYDASNLANGAYTFRVTGFIEAP